MSSLTVHQYIADRRVPPPPSRPNKISNNNYTAAAMDFDRPQATGDESAVRQNSGGSSRRKHHQVPHRQYLVSFREGATKPSELFGSLKKAGRMLLGEKNHSNSSQLTSSYGVDNSSSSGGNNNVPEERHEEGKTKCQCRHHQKKLREQNKLDEQRYTRAILSANNLFSKAGSEVGINEEDSLDGLGHVGPRPLPPATPSHTHQQTSKVKGHSPSSRRSQEAAFSSDQEEEDDEESADEEVESRHQHPPPPPPGGKPSQKSSMLDQSNQSQKSSAMSKASKTSRPASSRPQGAESPKKAGSTINLNPFSGPLWERREPFGQLWVTLSAMYGKVLVLLMIAFCLIEVMDNKVAPLTFQAYFMMYLYIGSIIAIMCIYITVLLDNCPSLTNSRENLTTAGDPEVGSIGSLGTLKRAHINRKKISRTSFYLRIGALVFGLATLIFNGLEIAMHATMNDKNCVDDVVIAHPILQALFTFLQMHFLFVNSTVIVERFGFFARFGFIHLVATNLSLWVRTIIWESASEWIHHVYAHTMLGIRATVAQDVIRVPDSPLTIRRNDDYFTNDRSLRDFGNYDYVDGASTFSLAARTGSTCNQSLPISQEHISKVISLYACFNDNTLGKLWTSSMPYLFPFIVEYSLIAAAVTYIMWRSVGQDKIFKMEGKKLEVEKEKDDKKKRAYWRVDCQSASKGLFLGLLTLVGGIIILIIFFVMKETPEYRAQMHWIYAGAEIVIMGVCVFASLAGFVQIQKLSHSFTVPYDLDSLLSTVTITGSYIFAIFSILAAIVSITEVPSMIVFVQSALLLIQITLQGMVISEAARRVCTTRAQQLAKPGRQIITFLLFANITLWVIDTFMSHREITQGVQSRFYGLLAWGIISRISLPLLVFYRFHSCVVLVEIWKNTYRTKENL